MAQNGEDNSVVKNFVDQGIKSKVAQELSAIIEAGK